ncbi:MAG TPA: hypothetical protein VGD21_13150 [Lysobacter sp.]
MPAAGAIRFSPDVIRFSDGNDRSSGAGIRIPGDASRFTDNDGRFPVVRNRFAGDHNGFPAAATDAATSLCACNAPGSCGSVRRH